MDAKFDEYVAKKLEADYKAYLATKLATDPTWSQKYVKSNADGVKEITFTPEMFAAVTIEEFEQCRCSCNPWTGYGDNCGSDKGNIFCDQDYGTAT
jgi:hypothetical protein